MVGLDSGSSGHIAQLFQTSRSSSTREPPLSFCLNHTWSSQSCTRVAISNCILSIMVRIVTTVKSSRRF